MCTQLRRISRLGLLTQSIILRHQQDPQGTSSYDNKSGALTATSQSSADVELTVEVAVGNNGSVDLVSEAPSTDGYTAATVADANAFAEGTYYTKSGSTYTKATEYAASTDYYEVSDPELYLALVVGSDITVLEAGKTASKTVTIAGIDSNFETTYNSTSEKYEYTVKSTELTAWNNSAFYLTGVASKASAENVTAPTLTVTWSYADPAGSGSASAPSASAESIAAGGNVIISLPSGVTITEVQKLKVDGTYNTLPAEYYVLEDVEGGQKLTVNANIKTAYAAATSIKVLFSSGDPIIIGIE